MTQHQRRRRLLIVSNNVAELSESNPRSGGPLLSVISHHLRNRSLSAAERYHWSYSAICDATIDTNIPLPRSSNAELISYRSPCLVKAALMGFLAPATMFVPKMEHKKLVLCSAAKQKQPARNWERRKTR